ncbi:MAG: hypothetical protein AAFS10_21960, partial [Myxococcota bacterium]
PFWAMYQTSEHRPKGSACSRTCSMRGHPPQGCQHLVAAGNTSGLRLDLLHSIPVLCIRIHVLHH